MPPVISNGMHAAAAAKKKVLIPANRASSYQSHSTAPTTAPTAGKKHIAYFILRSSHSVCGTGITLYVDKAVRNDLNNSIYITFFIYWNSAVHFYSGVSPFEQHFIYIVKFIYIIHRSAVVIIIIDGQS